MQQTAGSTRKVSLSLVILASIVFGVAFGLFGLNYWHSARCAEAHTPEEIEGFLQSLQKRLLTAESQTTRNSLLMEKIISSMQSQLFKVEAVELDLLSKHSQDEAVRIELKLAEQPAPVTPEYKLNPKYLDAEVLADTIDDILSKVGTDEESGDDLFGGEGVGQHDGGDWWPPADDDRSPSKTGSDRNSKGGGLTSLSDAEAILTCQDWKNLYSVVVGVSWGHLPYDLQQKWLKLSCDVHLAEEAKLAPELDVQEGLKGMDDITMGIPPSPSLLSGTL